MTMEAPFIPRGARPPGRAPARPPARPAVPSTAGQPIRGARRIIKPVGLIAVSPGSDSGALRLNWPQSGRVLHMMLGAYDSSGLISADESSSLLQIQILVNGDKHIITNGESGDFAQFRALCPYSAPWFPLDLPVRVNEPWVITVRNVGGSSTLVPEVLFSWREGQ